MLGDSIKIFTSISGIICVQTFPPDYISTIAGSLEIFEIFEMRPPFVFSLILEYQFYQSQQYLKKHPEYICEI
jgi:hypothetical protein